MLERRFKEYYKQTDPTTLDYLRGKNNWKDLDGYGTIQEVSERIWKLVEPFVKARANS